VGLGFAASVALFLFLGMWADGRLGTSPWLLILGAFIGGAAGFWSMYRKLVVAPRRNDRETTDRT
jgi:F0F1-type ATP synthase assembly protein I